MLTAARPFHGTDGEDRAHWGRVRYEREFGFHRRDSPITGLIIGMMMIFIGLSFLLREYGIPIPWWEIILILFGVYIVARWFRVWNCRK